MSKLARISEALINQSNNSAGDISVPSNLIGITIRCTEDSAANVWIGWNENATNKNFLSPGDSISYGNIEGVYLDGNKLQIGFDPSQSGGKCLISFLIDTGETCD